MINLYPIAQTLHSVLLEQSAQPLTVNEQVGVQVRLSPLRVKKGWQVEQAVREKQVEQYWTGQREGMQVC